MAAKSLTNLFALVQNAGACLAERCDKQVEFRSDGGELQIQPSAVETIASVLLRLVCNCVGYGLESCVQRQQLGKPDSGTIWMIAHAENDVLHLDVTDDGCGIATADVRMLACQLGLIEHPEHGLSDAELLSLLFDSRFEIPATAAVRCGCGLPLAGIHDLLTATGGNISVASLRGMGTTFCFTLPRAIAPSAPPDVSCEPDYEQSTRQTAMPRWWQTDSELFTEPGPHLFRRTGQAID
ncbi:MAG: hypothetical protein KDA85_22525 [Planctomycetaceae bacterium]|nr:hypothetical protein [Planctomycetaceae bacterium]